MKKKEQNTLTLYHMINTEIKKSTISLCAIKLCRKIYHQNKKVTAVNNIIKYTDKNEIYSSASRRTRAIVLGAGSGVIMFHPQEGKCKR
jgi:hypothetical protein